MLLNQNAQRIKLEMVADVIIIIIDKQTQEPVFLSP